MPSIVKQNGKPAMAPRPMPTRPIAKATPAPAPSILSRAIDVSQLEDEWVKMVLYGPNRVGKTTLASQFPKPLLIIDFEPSEQGGARSVMKIPGVKVLKIDSIADAAGLAEELERDTYYVSTVVDSGTSLQDVALKEYLGRDPVQLSFGEVSDEGYRKRSEKAKEILRMYLRLRKHTIVLAKEKDHNPPKGERIPKLVRGLQSLGESFMAADLGGGTVSWLHDACPFICRLFIEKELRVTKRTTPGVGKPGTPNYKPGKTIEEVEETGRLVRMIRTAYHPNFAGGFRSPTPESVPEIIEGTSPEDLFQKLWKAIKG